MWAQVIAMILGLVVMIAPSVADFDTTASNNNYIIGPLVITIAMVAITDVARNLRWCNIPLGAWLILSPFIIGFDGAALWWNVLSGAAIVFLSCFRGSVKQRFGGGWRSLFQKNPPHMQEAGGQPADT